MNIKQFILGLFKPKKKAIKYNEKQIINLRNKGYTQEQIAEVTGLTKNQVVGILFRLIKEGKIQRKRLLKRKSKV